LNSPSSSLESILTRAWRRRGWLACLLWPLSLLFGGLSRLRGALYRSGRLPVTRLPVPVIVVGNIYVGGTGKTPLVIWLVQKLRAAGYQPGVISRGYGAQASMPQLVGAAASAAAVGDEPLLLAERCGCPVMVGRKRPAAAQALLAAFPQIDVIVADDGLQHTALARDIEIVLFDERGVGNGWLLPAGPLREPASRRRDFTVLNVAQAIALARAGRTAETVAAMETPVAAPSTSATTVAAPQIGVPAGMPIFHMHLVGVLAERLINRAQRMPLTPILHIPAVAGRTTEAAAEPAAQTPEAEPQASRVVAAAGIGNPARFFSMLRATGLVFDEMPLPDHYPFVENPFAAELADIILITEKDAVKCSRHPALKNDPRLWVVPVTAHIDDALAEHILEKLRGYPTA
jgi:tetraacyldisaccharide 4'-kinase